MLGKINIWVKIVIPNTLLIAFVTALVSVITINIIYKRIDERIEGQMKHAAKGISSMGFFLNDDFLKSAKLNEVIGADMIAYTHDGRVIATSFPRYELDDIMVSVYSEEIEAMLLPDTFFIRDIKYRDKPFKVVYNLLKELDKSENTILALIVSTGDIEGTKRQSAMTVVLVAITGVVMAAIIGILIAFSITAPVKELVRMTERIASGDLATEAKVITRDEIGVLAKSFNEMTNELKSSRDRLVQSERLAVMGQLTAGIAHEIRNPLTSMKMTVQLLKRKQSDDPSKESLQVILDEINRLEIIVSGLLDYARPMELGLVNVNPITIVDEILRLMGPNLRHRKVEIIKSENDLPEISIDPNRMKQVFMNIFINSMQAMPNGGKLYIDYRYIQEKEIIQIDISDTGIGMPKDVLVHAFDPFFSAKSGGTGLGLANVKRIIELHKGEVEISSIENQGTKLTIKLAL